MQQAPYDSFTYADPWTTVREHGENLEQELQKEIKFRKVPNAVTFLPDDIILNTQLAFDINVNNPK